MYLGIEKLSDDGTQREVWGFLVLPSYNELRIDLAAHLTQERPSRRHKWKTISGWSEDRIASFVGESRPRHYRDDPAQAEEVPYWVIVEMRKRVVELIQLQAPQGVTFAKGY